MKEFIGMWYNEEGKQIVIASDGKTFIEAIYEPLAKGYAVEVRYE